MHMAITAKNRVRPSLIIKRESVSISLYEYLVRLQNILKIKASKSCEQIDDFDDPKVEKYPCFITRNLTEFLLKGFFQLKPHQPQLRPFW